MNATTKNLPEIGEAMPGRGLCIEFDDYTMLATFTRRSYHGTSRVWDVVCFDVPNGRQIMTFHTARDARRFVRVNYELAQSVDRGEMPQSEFSSYSV